jgi:hypothetical protein
MCTTEVSIDADTEEVETDAGIGAGAETGTDAGAETGIETEVGTVTGGGGGFFDGVHAL